VKRLTAVVGIGVAGLTGCVTPSAAPLDGPATRPTNELPALSFDGEWPAGLDGLEVWQRTAAGDEWGALALASQQGANGLLSRLTLGGPAARAAALAWPHVPTAWAFRGEWCARGLRYHGAEWADLLRALGASAEQRDTVGEELEPESVGFCDRWVSLANLQVKADTSGHLGLLRDALSAAESALSRGAP
jgi:hypothetical protein